jgi:plasmid stabilization system protein ParE
MWVLADRRLILALFSALCLSGALLVAVASDPMLGWTYPAGFKRVGHIAMVVVVSSLLLATTIAQLFPAWRRGWLVLPLMVETAMAWAFLPLGINALTPLLWRVAFIPALGLAGWAVWQRRQGAWLVLLGLAATHGLFERDPKHFERTDFVFGFLPVTLGFIAAIAVRLRGERRQARDTKLTAARLEIELLKKSLQPHFLMNTLTALAQVIEEKPAAAVRLIDDLAAEFRSLARFSGQRQVSIAEELALCRAHLGVMGARTDVAWKLEAEGIAAAARVPPALFLTLIENGFSHQRAQPGATTFTLRAEPMEGGVRYVFLSPGAVTPEPARADGGTGLRYVRARLEESFPGAWKLTQRAVAGGWETVIELRLSARIGAGP